MRLIVTAFVVCLLFATAVSSHAFWSAEPVSLKELAVGVAIEMKKKVGGGKKLFLDTDVH